MSAGTGCSRCGRTAHEDGSAVTWTCAMCGALACRVCTLTVPRHRHSTGATTYYGATLCSRDCWAKNRVDMPATDDPGGPAVREVLHLVSGPGEPYVDDMTECVYCNTVIAPPDPEFWTDDREAWNDRRVPAGFVRCVDVLGAELEAYGTMSS